MGSFLYVLIQFMRYEASYCKIIYKIEVGISCKMNPIWYMVRYLNNIHLRPATLSVSGGRKGRSVIVLPCRAELAR